MSKIDPLEDARNDYRRALSAYNHLADGLVGAVRAELTRIKTASDNDEPRSPEDAALLGFMEKVLDLLNSSSAIYREGQHGNN